MIFFKRLLKARSSSFLAMLVLMFTAVGLVRADSEDFAPSSANQPGRQYPQVNAEGCVRARIAAPEATSVMLDIGGVRYPMTKGADGIWQGESKPQDEGFHYYQLVIDGAQVPDPGSRYFYGCGRWGSAVEVPARDKDFYTLKNVPHGQLRDVFYFSKNSDSVRHCVVYTPPGYDRDPQQRFPVLYLQHGMGEDETGWGNQGHAGRIMDNLIADGKVAPFIIVMDNGNIGAPRRGGSPVAAPDTELSRAIAGPGGNRFNFDTFAHVLIEDLIPYIDNHFRTLADQPHRAMAGLSMGGMQTRSITLANLDTFSYIGIFSGGSIAPSEITDMEAFKMNNRLVFVSYGSREVAGGMGATGKADVDALNAEGVNSRYYVSQQTAHEWQSWRRSLYQFSQLVFK